MNSHNQSISWPLESRLAPNVHVIRKNQKVIKSKTSKLKKNARLGFTRSSAIYPMMNAPHASLQLASTEEALSIAIGLTYLDHRCIDHLQDWRRASIAWSDSI